MINESEVITAIEEIQKSEKNSSVPMSQQVAQARSLLLTTLQGQLTNHLVEQLQTQDKGVPFINIDNDPPQLAAIKKVINCLYHAEEALKTWEGMSSYFKMAKGSYSAISQLYSALSLLTDATPEIQAIFANNYSL